MKEFVLKMRRAPRDADAVRFFKRTFIEAVIGRATSQAVNHEQTASPCPCQFLIQQQFALPDPLRPNVRLAIEGSYQKSPVPPHIPDPDDRARYLGVMINHACGDAAGEEPSVQWGFAIETGSGWGFRKGPERVFLAIQAHFGENRLPYVDWSAVPNLPAFWRAFVGRRVSAAELEERWTHDQLVETVASDLDALHDYLGGS